MSEEPAGGWPEITWGHVFKVWWLLAWRGFLGLLIIGGLVGYVVGLALNGLGASKEVIATVNTIIGLGVYLLWGLVVVRMAIKKTYQDFHLAYTPH